jgi:putative GTP pyrophosphokinase
MDGSEVPEVKPANLNAVLSEFDGKKDLLERCCEKTKNLIEECLEDAQIRYQSVQARVKNRKKLQVKYSDPQKKYKRLDDITDLAALRIITYYEDEVDAVAELIKREFELDLANCVDRRSVDPDRFSYHAINFVCFHLHNRLSSVEYKRFSGLRFEIQITSILRHAWSEIQHDWYDLKDAFPPEIKRRFYRMAALLEVAESEFLELRNKKSNYQRSIAVQIEAKLSDIPLDKVSLRSLLEQDALVASIDGAIAGVREAGAALVQVSDSDLEADVYIANDAGLKTIGQLRTALELYERAIPEFARLCKPYFGDLPSDFNSMQGACVFYLGMLLAGKEGAAELFEILGLDREQVESISKIAEMVAAKYSETPG